MRLKGNIRSGNHLEKALKKAGGEFSPLYSKSVSRVKKLLEKNPVRTLIVMFLILLGNLSLGLYLIMKHEPQSVLNKAKVQGVSSRVQKSYHPGPSFSTFFELQNIKDTLDYLSSREGALTKEDTLLFIRMIDKYNALRNNDLQLTKTH